MDRLQEKDPAARKKLMHRHMQMMRNGMKMMTMMGGASGKPMDDRMEMMEKKMMMIQEMLPQLLLLPFTGKAGRYSLKYIGRNPEIIIKQKQK